MAHDLRGFLWDVEQACQAIFEFTEGMDEDGYLSNKLVRAGVERQFEIIGEALNQLSRHAPDLARDIPDLAAIVAFRNMLIHGYARIDDRLVWRNVRTRLPDLHATIRALRAKDG